VKDREIDTMNTSFIDLICCALGSMLMLMLFVACLIQASASKSPRAQAPAEQEKSGLDKLDEGFEVAPPGAMLVTVEWEGDVRYPLRVLASPPLPGQSGLAAQRVVKVSEGKFALTEENGLARVTGDAGTDSYFGFYERST